MNDMIAILIDKIFSACVALCGLKIAGAEFGAGRESAADENSTSQQPILFALSRLFGQQMQIPQAAVCCLA